MGAKKGYVYDGAAWQFIIGPEGPPGKPAKILGEVADNASLPRPGVPNTGYVTADNGHLWLWDDALINWTDAGKWRGDKGDKGAPGETLHPSGNVPTINDLAALGAVADLTVYVTQDTTKMYVYQPSSAAAIPAGQVGAGWVDMGQVQGPPGPAGPQGVMGQPGPQGPQGDPGPVPDGNDSMDYLTWDVTENGGAGGWVATANEFGIETNVSLTDDGGVPVMDKANNTFDVRKLRTDDLGDVSNEVPNDGEALVWDQATNQYRPGSVAQALPPVPKMEELADVYQNAAPNIGDVPVYQHDTAQNKNLWYFKNPEAFIKDWSRADTYVSGMTVYHDGRLWRATKTTTGVEPQIADGSCFMLISKVGESKIIHTPVEVSGNVPTATPPGGGTSGNWYAVQYVSDTNITFYKWGLTVLPPGSTPAYRMEWKPMSFINGITAWRNVATPPPMPKPDHGVFWIHGPQGNTLLPTIGQTDWKPLDFTNYLAALFDVSAATAAAGDLLTSNGSGLWEAKPLAAYTKAEVDAKIGAAVQGLAHGEAVAGIITAPPATLVNDVIYIIGAGTGGPPNPTFAGHVNDLAYWDGAAWVFVTPKAGETHLNEADQSMYSWNGTAWVKIGLAGTPGATGPAGPAGANGKDGTSIKTAIMSLADYQALPNKDPLTLYLLDG